MGSATLSPQSAPWVTGRVASLSPFAQDSPSFSSVCLTAKASTKEDQLVACLPLWRHKNQRFCTLMSLSTPSKPGQLATLHRKSLCPLSCPIGSPSGGSKAVTVPPGTVGDGGDHPRMAVAGPVSRRSRMEEDPGSVLGSDPPVLLLGYRKIAVSRLTDVERFQGDQLWETPRPQSPLAGSSLSGSLRGVGLLEKLEG